MTIAIESSAATRRFAGGAGVSEVDLDVGPGEIHALVGLNGAGKSTLMRLLLGMLRPHRGACRLLGHDPAGAPTDVWRQVGHLVETPFAYGELSGRTNVELAARLHGLEREATPRAVDAVLDELGVASYGPTRARCLSLGNRQRLGLAAALVHEPSVIVLDEPSNSLDPAGVILLRESLLRRARDGAAVLVSSHHLDEVSRIADRITVLGAGCVIGKLDPAGVDLERAFFALVHADDERRATAERAGSAS